MKKQIKVKMKAKAKVKVKRASKRKTKSLPKPKLQPLEEVKAEESKYHVEPQAPPQKFTEQSFELPAEYGDTRIVLMVRDPHWIFSYWETWQKEKEKILRVYETANWIFFDIKITGAARSWYIKVPYPGKSWCVEIGYKAKDGKFAALARSNVVTTPIDGPSEVIDEKWAALNWEKLYKLSKPGSSQSGISSFR